MDLRRKRTARYAILSLALAGMGGVLGWMLSVMLHAHGSADEATQATLRSLATACVGLLGVTGIALIGVLLRWVRFVMRFDAPLPEAHYVDAWSEAGRRMQAPPAGNAIDVRDEDDDSDTDDEDDEDDEDEWA